MHQLGRITPDEREAMRLGRRGFERGDVGVGIRELNRLLRTRPRYADAHYMVGMLHEKNGDLESARLSLEQALRINAGGQGAIALLYQGEHEFRLSVNTGARLVFEVVDGQAVALTLHQGTTAMKAKRVAGDGK